ncbi:hypothetical protein VX159_12015 [Dechloromonas sp. ZY10]|uniref:hypothetical protein n=1 Tax=Dechloromonas aquae TaxID=2664436 RepID=UPI003528CC06
MMRPHSFSARVSRYFALLFALSIAAVMCAWYFGVPALGLTGEWQRHVTGAVQLLEQGADYQQSLLTQRIKERRGDLLVLAENEVVARALQRPGEVTQATVEVTLERLLRAYPDHYRYLQILDPGSGEVRFSTSASQIGRRLLAAETLRAMGEPGVHEMIRLLPDAGGGGWRLPCYARCMR